MSEEKDYYVVFRKTAAQGNHQGVMTIIPFRNKAKFKEWYTSEVRRNEEVVAEGVTKERAHELADQTPVKCLVLSSFESARQENGEIDFDILKMNLANLFYCLPKDKREEALALARSTAVTEALRNVLSEMNK